MTKDRTIDHSGSAGNHYKVPRRQWRKWDKQERVIFNYLYSLMSKNQDLFMHPECVRQRSRYWKTTAWNAAWLAADAVRDLR